MVEACGVYGCYEDETEALKIIVEKLVACKRYVTAVNIIGHSECEAVINAECIYKLNHILLIKSEDADVARTALG